MCKRWLDQYDLLMKPNIILMRYSAYQSKPDRYNPQFLGIADRYYQQKHHREEAQTLQQSARNSYFYEKNQNAHLRKTIEMKSKELKKLKESRTRHQQELRDKEDYRITCADELTKLKIRNQQTRAKSRSKLAKSREAILQRNQGRRELIKSETNSIKGFLQTVGVMSESHKEDLYLQGKEKYLMGQMRIDAYFRSKNKQTTEQYKRKIEKEKLAAQQNTKDAEQFEKKMKKLNNYLQKNKNALHNIEEQISKYRKNYQTISNKSNLVSAISCESKTFFQDQEMTQ